MESSQFVDLEGLRALYVAATLAWQEAQTPKSWSAMCSAGLEYRTAAYDKALQGFLWAEGWEEKMQEEGTSQQRALARNGLRAATNKVNKALEELATAEALVQSK